MLKQDGWPAASEMQQTCGGGGADFTGAEEGRMRRWTANPFLGNLQIHFAATGCNHGIRCWACRVECPFIRQVRKDST